MENQPTQPTEVPTEQSVPLDERLQKAPDSSPDLMFDPEARQAQADHAAYMDTRPGEDVTSADQYNQHFDEKRSEHLDSTTKDYRDMTFYETRKNISDAQDRGDESTVNEIYRTVPDTQLAKMAAFARHNEAGAEQDRIYEEVFDRIKIMSEQAGLEEEQAVEYFEGIIDKADRSMNGEKIREPEDEQGQSSTGAETGTDDAGVSAEQGPSSDQEQFSKEVNDYHEDLLAQNHLYLEHLEIMKNYQDTLAPEHPNKTDKHTDPAKYRSMLREAAQNNIFNRWVDNSYKDKLASDETLRGLRTPDQASMQQQAVRKKELLEESQREVYERLSTPQETPQQPAKEDELPDAARPQEDPATPPYSPPEPGRNNPDDTDPLTPASSRRNTAKAKIRSIARKSPVKIRRKVKRPDTRTPQS